MSLGFLNQTPFTDFPADITSTSYKATKFLGKTKGLLIENKIRGIGLAFF